MTLTEMIEVGDTEMAAIDMHAVSQGVGGVEE